MGAWALHCIDTALLTVHCVGAGAERARDDLLKRARRVCQLVREQERHQAAERQRLVEAPLAAQAPYRRHAAIRVARKDDAMIFAGFSRLYFFYVHVCTFNAHSDVYFLYS